MVLKLRHYLFIYVSWFENDVKMYGTQASLIVFLHFGEFENDVKMYGTQANQVGKQFYV